MNGYCGRALHDEISSQYGEDIEHKFFSVMRGAKNRATNPNNKDYNAYASAGWWFDDSFDFADHELKPFVEAVEKYGVENVSIDRIDAAAGYRPGNIRWVPIADNLRNRRCVKPIVCRSIKTSIETFYDNCAQCGEALNINSARIWECCNRKNHKYHNEYEFFYAERCND